MWNLKDKINTYSKTETNSDTENKLVVFSEEREGKGARGGRGLRDTNYHV